MKQRFLLSLLALAVAASADAVQSIDDLACPCRVTSFDMYLDGGTLGGTLEDRHGNVLGFCLDGRSIPVEFTADGESIAQQPKCFFLGAMHPEHDGARVLEYDGVEERALMGVLRDWIEEEVPAGKYGDLRAEYSACKTARGREELARDRGFSEDQARAMWVNRMIVRREAEVGATDSPR